MILAPLAVSFNAALADVLCNSEALHYRPRIISEAERNGFEDATDELCGNNDEKTFQMIFESMVFTRTRTEDIPVYSESICKASFQSIIEACISGKNTGGGNFITNGLTVEILLDYSNNEVRGLGAAEKKPAKKPEPAKPIATKPKGNKTPKPDNNKNPKKPKDKTPEKPPAKTTCSLKPGKTKGAGKDESNRDNKNPTKVVRGLIDTLLRRAGSEGKKSSDYGDCDFEAMTDGGDWGTDTWRGYRMETGNTISATTLVQIAKSAYEEVQAKRTSNSGIVAAALFVPGKGVYLGTPAHGTGTKKVQDFAENNASELWSFLENRRFQPGKSGALYHAEDIAMLLAIESGAR